MTRLNGAVIASAVALMLGAMGCGGSDDEDTGSAEQGVKCEGVNECKGMSECKSADGSSECQGLNECKGQGWTTVPSEADCTSQGGKVIG